MSKGGQVSEMSNGGVRVVVWWCGKGGREWGHEG